MIARNPDIDHFPVIDSASEERIIGLFEAHKARGSPDGQFVRDHFSTLTEGHLIGADAAILDFIRSADIHSCRLLVSNRGISGIITLSDLQALPVRAALFSMVTQLEMAMMEEIRGEFPSGEEWMGRLSPGRHAKVQAEMVEARERDAFVDALLFTQFCDKVDIIRKRPGFLGAARLGDDMKVTQRLRNALAHANDYAASRDQALRLGETVRNIDRWIQRFTAG